ncbi:hypothetical protein L1D44_07240 [Shewanella sp. Isolate13]|uniref:hypothetical protein n=1 Tax=Shewanella sp. Isolate13 TaxID=2908531 RepID=UPI001EFE887F|nr:hypothetical protein [Shewanella sp. Isolate13]MCG9729642.1 hypothetical protein [Shewanella sp. Isolate13]
MSIGTLLSVLAVTSVYAEQYVFPEKGQSPQQQASDEASCNKWAIEQTGYNPNEVTSVSEEAASVEPAGADRGSACGGQWLALQPGR